MIYIISDSHSVNKIFEDELKDDKLYLKVNNNFFNLNDNITDEDILILDIDQFNSVDLLMDYYTFLPKILKVIGILDSPKLSHGAFLIKKGFKSYIGKDTQKNIMKVVIDSVQKNNVWLYPQLMNYIIKHININSDDVNSSDIFEKLSKKEKEVAYLVSDGLSNKEIAQKLDVQLVTVKKHMTHIFTKLDIKDRLSLALLINK